MVRGGAYVMWPFTLFQIGSLIKGETNKIDFTYCIRE